MSQVSLNIYVEPKTYEFVVSDGKHCVLAPLD